MRKQLYGIGWIIASLIGLVLACKKEERSEWMIGSTRVKIHKHGTGRKPTMNDVVLLKYYFYTPDSDLVLSTYQSWDSVAEHRYSVPPYLGAIEQVIMELRAGDSVSVWLAADSLKKYQGDYPHRKDKPDSVFAGKYYHYALKVAAIKTEIERQTEILTKIEQEKIKQDSLIQKSGIFIATWKRDPRTVKDPSGMYYAIDEPGTGDLAAPGDSVILGYSGSLLTGDFFDVTEEPQGFIYGQKPLIPGWEIAFSKFLRKGTQARMILPSHLAFGHKGKDNLPPFVVLVFRMQVVDIIKAKDLPAYREKMRRQQQKKKVNLKNSYIDSKN